MNPAPKLKSNLMVGKRGLIMGVANDKSIAWGMARTLHEHGAELAFTYQGDAFKKRVEPLVAEIGAKTLLQCDASKDEDLKSVFGHLQKQWGKLDFIIHAIAFSNKEELKGRYLDTTLDNFLNTMHISCYSFTAVLRHAAPLMKEGGSAVTLTYYGAEKVMPSYNVMGVAKAALEASVRYLAADLGPRGIASTVFPLARCAHSPARRSAAPAQCSSTISLPRRCAAPSSWMSWVVPVSTFSPTFLRP